jgi:hypothetical protein
MALTSQQRGWCVLEFVFVSTLYNGKDYNPPAQFTHKQLYI